MFIKRIRFAGLILVLSSLMLTSGCKTELYSGLTEREANEIIAVLRLNNISADRAFAKSGEVTVRVEDSQFPMAVELLKVEGYPKHNYANLGQVFEGNGFVTSQTEERARFIFAMSEELSQTISEIDGILSARTHVVLPTADPLSRNSSPSSASVVIRHAATTEANNLLPQIKMMVANSIEGLTYDNVSVVFIPVEMRRVAANPALPMIAPQTASTMSVFWVGGVLIGLALLGFGAVGFLLNRSAGKRRSKVVFNKVV